MFDADIFLGLVLYCETSFSEIHHFFRRNPETFILLSWGKVGPFTFESHIHLQALKFQGFPKKVDALLNPYYTLIKNSTQTIFQGSTT